MGTHKLAAGRWTGIVRALRRLRSAVDSATAIGPRDRSSVSFRQNIVETKGFSERRTLP
jgi:hypothetical protein